MPRALTEDTRRRILSAATRLFGTRGYQATNIADIAAELGMGHGTFYRYFRSKRDILDHVVDEAIGRIDEVIGRYDPSSPTTVKEHARQVEAIGQALYEVFLRDLPAARLVFYDAPGVDDSVRTRVDTAFERFSSFTSAYLHNGKSRGYLRPDFDEDAAAAALTAIAFEGIRHLVRAADPAAEAARWVGTYQLLASGLASR